MTRRHIWFPGYTVAGVSALALLATAPGQTFIISLLNEPLRTTFDIGELTLNTAYAVATIAAAFPLVYVGRLTDAIGPRLAMAIAAFLFGAACIFMASVWGPLTVFLGFFLLRFLGQGALGLVSQHAIAMWFHRRLGSIHGLLQVGVFGLWIMFPQIAVRLIDAVGWRQTYIIFAAAILCLIPLALLFVRNRPEELGLKMDGDTHDPVNPDAGAAPGPSEDRPATPAQPVEPEAVFTLRQATRTRAYWTITAAVFFAPLIGTAFLFDMQPMLAARGMTARDSANTVSVWTATMCLMAVPSGYLTDRLRPSILISAGMALIGLSALILSLAFAPLTAAAAMLFFGIGQSILHTCAGTSLARCFGRTHHGAIRSATMRIAVIGTGMGPVFTGVSAKLTGGYNAAMIVFMAMAIPVAILAATLRRPELPAQEKNPAKQR